MFAQECIIASPQHIPNDDRDTFYAVLARGPPKGTLALDSLGHSPAVYGNFFRDLLVTPLLLSYAMNIFSLSCGDVQPAERGGERKRSMKSNLKILRESKTRHYHQHHVTESRVVAIPDASRRLHPLRSADLCVLQQKAKYVTIKRKRQRENEEKKRNLYFARFIFTLFPSSLVYSGLWCDSDAA